MDFCTSCGKPLDEGAAFCASCGAPRPQAEAPAPEAPAPAPEAAAPEAAVPVDMAAVAAEPTGADTKSRKALFLSAGALVVVAALVVGLLFVFGVFKSDDKGSSNPQAAVSDLVSSLASFDSGKALDVIAPGETQGFRRVVSAANGPGPKAAIDKLKNQLTTMANSGALPGEAAMIAPMLSSVSLDDLTNTVKAFSVKFANMQYKTTELGTDISNVEVTGGDITVALNKDKLPASVKSLVTMGAAAAASSMPPWLNDILNGSGHTWKISDFLSDVKADGQKLDAIVVKQDGRWYVSLYATIAQHIWEAENDKHALVQPDWTLYSKAPDAITAASPNDVPGNLAKAINNKSVKDILQNLPQSEVRALFPFAPLLQTELDKESSNPKISVTGVQSTTVKTEGNLVRVIYTQASATLTENGETESVAVKDGCYTSNGTEQCVSSWPTFAQTLAGIFGVDKGIPVTLQKVGNGYQLDPVATVVGSLADALNNADKLADVVTQAITYFQQKARASASSYDY